VTSVHLSDHVPEVLIKVVHPGSNTLAAVRVHLRAMARGKHRGLEDDQGAPVLGKRAVDRLIEDWDLDLEALLGCRVYFDPRRAKPPKLVHKIIFSMPRGTPPDKLLLAVRDLVREEFPPHRYALGLHTDEPHLHVHVIVKATGEQGRRLNIRKATLWGWREGFARLLRSRGVPAKATRRATRYRCQLIRGPVPSFAAQFPQLLRQSHD